MPLLNICIEQEIEQISGKYNKSLQLDRCVRTEHSQTLATTMLLLNGILFRYFYITAHTSVGVADPVKFRPGPSNHDGTGPGLDPDMQRLFH